LRSSDRATTHDPHTVCLGVPDGNLDPRGPHRRRDAAAAGAQPRRNLYLFRVAFSVVWVAHVTLAGRWPMIISGASSIFAGTTFID
jgi:hypothetical protein